MVRGLLCVALLLATVTARAESWPDKDWAKATPLAGPAVEALNTYAFPPRDDTTRQGIRTDALLVIRDGEIIYERYAAPTSASTPHLTWSISKSLMATVLGVAYGDNRFKLTDPVARFYPPMKRHPTVTMADLLHWASGLDWQEDYEYAPLKSSVVAMLYTRGHADMAEFAANTEAAGAPGRAFRYSSGDSNLLSADEATPDSHHGRPYALGLGPGLAGRLRIRPAEILGGGDAVYPWPPRHGRVRRQYRRRGEARPSLSLLQW